jgi:hypothetical protein
MGGRDWTRKQFVVRFLAAGALLIACLYVLAAVATHASS